MQETVISVRIKFELVKDAFDIDKLAIKNNLKKETVNAKLFDFGYNIYTTKLSDGEKWRSAKMPTFQGNTYDSHREITKEFMDNLVLLEEESDSNEIYKSNEIVVKVKKIKGLGEHPIYQIFVSTDEQPGRIKVKRENNPVIKDTIQDCEKIIERILEILSDWSEIQDIKLQIQYAAVITGKIDNLKKTDYIQSNDTRKKICTLLKNVIRINVTDIVFSEKQISLLKKGFSLLLSEQIQKKDMLQLNREFLEQQLLTMPAWE